MWFQCAKAQVDLLKTTVTCDYSSVHHDDPKNKVSVISAKISVIEEGLLYPFFNVGYSRINMFENYTYTDIHPME